MKSSRTQMRQMRDREFLRHYRQTVRQMLDSGKEVRRDEAVRLTVTTGRPLFYLSYTRAYTVISHYFAHGDVPLKAAQQRAMWLELAKAVARTRQADPKLSLPQAIARTLATARASRFYITTRYANKLLYRIIADDKQHMAGMLTLMINP